MRSGYAGSVGVVDCDVGGGVGYVADDGGEVEAWIGWIQVCGC